jgi:hypothetical protein
MPVLKHTSIHAGPFSRPKPPVCPPKERIKHGPSRPVSVLHSSITREKAQQHNSPCSGMPLNQYRLIVSASVCLPPTFFPAPMQEAARTTAFSSTFDREKELLPLARKRRCPLLPSNMSFWDCKPYFSKRLFAMRSFFLPTVDLPCDHCTPSKPISAVRFLP